MNITVIEANMTGLQHSVINRLILNMLNSMVDVKKISLYCSSSHYSALSIKNLEKIDYHEISVLEPGKKRIKKFFLEYFQTKNILKSNNDDLYLLLSCFPNVHYFLSKASIKLKDKKLLIVTHGEAEGLVMKGKWKIWSYPFWITKTFKHSEKDHFYRLVLGNSILMNLKKLGYHKRLFSIEHPYEDFKEYNNVIPQKGKNIFGYIGNCLKTKGGETFITAANKNAFFWIVGIYALKNTNLNENIKILSNRNKMLSFQEFNNYVDALTYACYPYPSESYKFTASGAVFDALKHLKPIIYIKNDYFDEILNSVGDIGYRCENEQEFIETVQKLSLNDDFVQYEEQVRNLRNLQGKFTWQNIKSDFEKIIKQIIEKDCYE